MVSEGEMWRREDGEGEGPVWGSKEETDRSFDYGVGREVEIIAEQVRATGESKIGAVFATRNSISTDLGIRLLEKYGLAERSASNGRLVVSSAVAGSLAFAQLYGGFPLIFRTPRVPVN